MWTEIKTQVDIDVLEERYGYFHDSCIRDFYVSMRAFVDKDLSMGFDNKQCVSILFQRQYASDSVLELKFEDCVRFNYCNGDDILFDAGLVMEGGLFYWTECEINDLDATWVCGERVFYRFHPELLGNINRIEISR